MYIEFFHGNCLRMFDWIYKPWAKSRFSCEAERGLWVTAWRWSHGGAGVLGMGPGRAVDAIEASQRIWDTAEPCSNCSWRKMEGEHSQSARYIYSVLHCVFLWAKPTYIWGYLKCCPWLIEWLEPKNVIRKLCAFLPDCPNFMYFAYVYKHQCFISFLIRVVINVG